MIDWKPLARALAAQLTASGHLRSPEWQEIFAVVPRHEFVPVFFEQHAAGQWQQVDGADPAMRDQWLSAVYSNTTLVTALEDVTLPPGHEHFAVAVSSSTEPGLMAQMLEDLDLHPGHKVLEIGTGTGYNAALMCERLGEDHVFSVDLRGDQVETARRRLAHLGYHPTLVTANGADGLPDHGPYDRIIATCSVQYIPPAWIEQLHAGGMLLADLEGTLYTGNLALLHRYHHSTTVQGRFSPRYGSFMPMQHQLGIDPGRSYSTNSVTTSELSTTLSPDFLHQRQHPLAFYTQLHLPPGTQLQLTSTGAGTRLVAPDGSWCDIAHQPDPTGRHHLTRAGPIRLWNIVERAHQHYMNLNRPEWERFGVTATPTEQHIWLDSPDSHEHWALPLTSTP